jgi:hypothetical protein
MNRKSRHSKTAKRRPSGDAKRRPSGDKADKALGEVIEAERERGEINIGAEPDQKSDIKKQHETD